MRTLFIGTFIDTPAATELRIREGAVLVSSNDGRGVIEKLKWDIRDEASARASFGLGVSDEVDVVILQQEGKFWFPGFIDTHIHAPQYPNSGIFGKSTLLDWLKKYTFPLESSLGSPNSPMYQNESKQPDPLGRARTIYSRIINRTLSHGTTTAAYYATIHVEATNLLAKLAFDKGQRAYIGRVCMDRPEICPDFYRDESTEDTVRKTKESIEFCDHLDSTRELIAPIITPRFAPSCLPETLTELGKIARDNSLRIQTHISENTNELKLVSELFPQQNSYTHVYDVHGLLTDRTILAHGIHFSDEEVQMIKQRKSKISHCPASNSALGSGLCPVRRWIEQGLDVGLGTDVSGGYSPSILEAVRQTCLVSRMVGHLNGGESAYNIGVTEGLWLATVGGAKVTGMSQKLGLFELGMLWDVQEIQIGDFVNSEDTSIDLPVDIFGWEDWEDKIAKWVWNGDDRNVHKVWVGGRLCHTR